MPKFKTGLGLAVASTVIACPLCLSKIQFSSLDTHLRQVHKIYNASIRNRIEYPIKLSAREVARKNMIGDK
jgi:hypothetical protein